MQKTAQDEGTLEKTRRGNGIVAKPKNIQAVRKVDPAILIFDVDGVLVDVKETYWRSGLQTVQFLTVKKPTWANFCATAPPTPQRTPTSTSLSSTGCPCASNVLRPSDCHFEVAPITTATCLPLALVFILDFPLCV